MLIIRQLKPPILLHSSYCNSVSIATPARLKPTTFTLPVLQVSGFLSPINPLYSDIQYLSSCVFRTTLPNVGHYTQTLVWVRSPNGPSCPWQASPSSRKKGNLQSCVSDLAEVVAGYGPLHHVLSIHLEDAIAAVCDERCVRQRHALVAKGDDRVPLEGRKRPPVLTAVLDQSLRDIRTFCSSKGLKASSPVGHSQQEVC